MQEVMFIPEICRSFVFGEQSHCQRSGTLTVPKVEQNQAALLLNWGLNCLEVLHHILKFSPLYLQLSLFMG